MQDLKFAFRLLNKHRLFSLAVIVTMTLAIGVNTAAFGILDALLLRPLPVHAPGRLVHLRATQQKGDRSRSWTALSYPDFVDYRDGTSAIFSGIGLYEPNVFLLGVGAASNRVNGGAVTRGFFRVLGIRPLLGRTFAPHEQTPTTPVYQAVISKRYWRSHFGGSKAAIGKSLIIDHHRFTVSGVVDAPLVFRALGWGTPNVWVTLGTFVAIGHGCPPLDSRDVSCYSAFARLRPEVDLTAAQQSVDRVTARLATKYPKRDAHRHVAVDSAGTAYGLMGYDRRDIWLIAWSLMGVAAAILLIACANIVNLFLARGARRVREIAIRMTLGANVGTIARQLLIEALLLSTIGAAAGLLAGWFGIAYIDRLRAFSSLGVALDWRVGLFTALTALGAGLLFSLAPLWPVLKTDLFNRLTVNSDALSGRQSRIRDGLVVLQISLCLALLVCAGLFLRTVDNAYSADLGFDPEQVLTVRVNFPGSKPPLPAALARVRNRIDHLAGIAAVGFISSAPLDGMRSMLSLHIPGFNTPQNADFASVVDGYFKVLGTPLLRGKPFSAFAPGNTSVVIVNRAFVRQYWPHGWTRGKLVRTGHKVFTVAGVVDNIRHNGIRQAAIPRVYYRFPASPIPSSVLDVVVRTPHRAADRKAAVAGALHALFPRSPPPRVHALSERVQSRLASVTQIALFLTLFGAIALTLAVVGVYALLAYLVIQRTAEIGLRQALGARYWDIVGLFARKSALLVTIGTAVGLAAAVVTMRALRHFLYGVTPTDPTTLAGAVIVFSIIAGVATYLPARRAARLDPVEALHVE